MAKRLEINGNYLILTDTVTGIVKNRLPSSRITYDIYNGTLHVYYINRYDQNFNVLIDDLVDLNNLAFASEEALNTFLSENTAGLKATIEGTVDVAIQDQTTQTLIVKASNLVAETTIAIETAKDDLTVNVTSASGFVVGQYMTIYNAVYNRVYFANILSINALAIGVDTPLDFEFPVGSFVSVGNTNMNVNGSVTPQIFGVRNPSGVDIPLTYDITRLMFKCLTNAALDLSRFGDISGGLLKGIVIRKKDGSYYNILNAKTNGDLKGLMYDFDIQVASNQQQDGFTGRLTFAGSNKLGVAIRLAKDEDLQIIIQDDLTSLVKFEILTEGHVVD